MNPMILGLDGGGSKTEVRIARVNSSGHCDIVSRGNAGPSNMFAAGETVARDIAAFVDTDQHCLRRQGTLRHATKAFDPDRTIRLDPTYDETQLVHMGEQHDRRSFAVALQRGDENHDQQR